MSSLKVRLACLTFLIMVVLLTACQPAGKPVEEQSTRLTSDVKAVSAQTFPSGAVHVAIVYERGFEEAVTLSCTYPGEDGQPRQYTYVDNRPGTVKDSVRLDSLDFVVKKPREYLITCQIGSTEASAAFTIGTPPSSSAALTPTIIPPASTTDGASQTSALGPFTSGRMWFEFAQATSGGPNSHLLQGCLPGLKLTDSVAWHYGDNNFKVALDGTLTGECSASGTTSDGTQSVTSKLTEGRFTQDGQGTFQLKTARTFNLKDGTAEADLVFIGAGKFISSTTASGTANWTATCQGNVAGCSAVTDSGTIPWVIDFYP